MRTHKSQHVCVCGCVCGYTHAMIYYSGRIQSYISKGKCVRDGVLGKPGTPFKSHLPVESCGLHSIPPATVSQHTWNVVQQGSSLDSVSKVFIRGWSQRQPLLGTCQNSRLPERKFVFHIKRTICINTLGTVTQSYQSGGWEPPEFQVPGC